jgi:predicted ferric reductase
LSVINIILLSNSLACNKKQQFIEWKVNAKILRYTIGLFILFHIIVCINRGFNMLEIGAHLMNLLAVETVLAYRIDSIQHLEDLADQYARERGGK